MVKLKRGMEHKTHCAECEFKDAFEQKPVNRYHYRLSGLPNVYLKGVLQGTCPDCGAVSVSIPRVQELSESLDLCELQNFAIFDILVIDESETANLQNRTNHREWNQNRSGRDRSSL